MTASADPRHRIGEPRPLRAALVAMLIWLGPTPATLAAMADVIDLPSASGSVLDAPGNPLSLSDAQRDRIQEIVTESQAYAGLLKSELDAARSDLKRQLDQPDPDFDAVMRDVDRIGELETRLRKHRIATLISLRAVLSPDQRAGLTQIFRTAPRRGGAPATAAPEAPGAAPAGP